MARRAMRRPQELPSASAAYEEQEAVPPVDLPTPIDPTADLRHLPWMKWPFDETVASEAWAAASPWEQLARINLFATAWRSIPAASLPQEEKILKAFSKSGTRWPKVRDFALDGFKLHADNRLYHPILTSLAQEAWKHVLSNRTRQAQFRARRNNRDDPRDVTVTRGVIQRTRDNETRENQKLRGEFGLPPAEPWDARTREYAEDIAKGKKEPFWPANQWGPPPDKPGTQVPPEFLRQYGFVYEGVTPNSSAACPGKSSAAMDSDSAYTSGEHSRLGSGQS